jgi:hypothetical protein
LLFPNEKRQKRRMKKVYFLIDMGVDSLFCGGIAGVTR